MKPDIDALKQLFPSLEVTSVCDQAVMTIPKNQFVETLATLKEHSVYGYDQLMDLCGVDYLHYGIPEWETEQSTHRGYGRAQAQQHLSTSSWKHERFAVVLQLLSIKRRERLRVKVYLAHDDLCLPSVSHIWPSAIWYEREAYDLFGIVFENHPDLRRILTDYGFIGYPFRKDFPLEGLVEKRYDASAGKCIDELMSQDPYSIQPRTGVPKVIRQDNRNQPMKEHD